MALEALKAIEEKKEQLRVNLRDIVSRKAQLELELGRLKTEGQRLNNMLTDLESQFPTSKYEKLIAAPTLEDVNV